MKETIIQFGEGGFLRGFADWMVQYANEKADFDGKVVVVQPIEKGMCDLLSAQDCVYTHLCRGAEGVDIKKIDVISRCVKPYDDFDAYMIFESLELARDLFDGKVNAIACVGSGDIVMKGMISMLDNLNRILDRVALYLA